MDHVVTNVDRKQYSHWIKCRTSNIKCMGIANMSMHEVNSKMMFMI